MNEETRRRVRIQHLDDFIRDAAVVHLLLRYIQRINKDILEFIGIPGQYARNYGLRK